MGLLDRLFKKSKKAQDDAATSDRFESHASFARQRCVAENASVTTDSKPLRPDDALSTESSSDFSPQTGELPKSPEQVASLITEMEQGSSGTEEALVQIGSPAVEPLIGVLAHEGIGPLYAAWALGRIKDERAISPLIDMMRTENTGLLYRAVEALGSIGGPAVPKLVQNLRNDDYHIRGGVAEALGEIKDIEAVLPLLDSLTDRVYVRWRAARALGKIGDSRATDALSALLNDSSHKVRKEAETALLGLGKHDLLTETSGAENAAYRTRGAHLDVGENDFRLAGSSDSAKYVAIPQWDMYVKFAEDEVTAARKNFYDKWLREFNKGIYLELYGNEGYLEFYLCNAVNEFYKGRNIELLLQGFAKVREGYSTYIKASEWIDHYTAHAYLLINDFDNAWLTWRARGSTVMGVTDLITFKGKCRDTSIDGHDLICVFTRSGLTRFGKESQAEVELLASQALDEFQRERGKTVVDYFGNLQRRKMTKQDLEYLRSFYPSDDEFREDVKRYEDPHGNYPYYLSVPCELEDNESGPEITCEVVPVLIEKALERGLKKILRDCENTIRVTHGLPKVGEGWIAESDLYYRLCEAFPKEKILQHAHPKWLGQQHLDIYFVNRNVACEYQGGQHENPVDYFGGQLAFEKLQELDARKRRLCEKHGCKLIYIYPDYDFSAIKREIKAAFT
jgi:HEAT repeats/PBS lyase HEAT-like repeat